MLLEEIRVGSEVRKVMDGVSVSPVSLMYKLSNKTQHHTITCTTTTDVQLQNLMYNYRCTTTESDI